MAEPDTEIQARRPWYACFGACFPFARRIFKSETTLPINPPAHVDNTEVSTVSTESPARAASPGVKNSYDQKTGRVANIPLTGGHQFNTAAEISTIHSISPPASPQIYDRKLPVPVPIDHSASYNTEFDQDRTITANGLHFSTPKFLDGSLDQSMLIFSPSRLSFTPEDSISSPDSPIADAQCRPGDFSNYEQCQSGGSSSAGNSDVGSSHSLDEDSVDDSVRLVDFGTGDEECKQCGVIPAVQTTGQLETPLKRSCRCLPGDDCSKAFRPVRQLPRTVFRPH